MCVCRWGGGWVGSMCANAKVNRGECGLEKPGFKFGKCANVAAFGWPTALKNSVVGWRSVFRGSLGTSSRTVIMLASCPCQDTDDSLISSVVPCMKVLDSLGRSARHARGHGQPSSWVQRASGGSFGHQSGSAAVCTSDMRICWAGGTSATAKAFSGLLGCISKDMTSQPRGWGACSTSQWGHLQPEDLVLFWVYVVYFSDFLILKRSFQMLPSLNLPLMLPLPIIYLLLV